MQAVGDPPVITEDQLVIGAEYNRAHLERQFQPTQAFGIGQVFTTPGPGEIRRPVALFCAEGMYDGDEINNIVNGQPMRWIFEGGFDQGIQVENQSTEVPRNKHMRILCNNNTRKLHEGTFMNRDFFHFFLKRTGNTLHRYMGRVLAINYHEPQIHLNPAGEFFKTCACILCPEPLIANFMAPGVGFQIV